ncbi:MAG: hypothetical protein ACRDK1_10950 [Solirubrobacterales bacterium]
MAAEPSPITLEAPPGDWPLRLVWDPGLAALSASEEPASAVRSAWHADPGPDWERAESLLLVSAVFEDGHSLALAALRPRKAQGHDHDQLLHRLEFSGDPVEMTEALLSTEYDAEGHIRRIGIELWIDPEAPPLRLGGDRDGEARADRDGPARREIAAMSYQLDGAPGFGTCEMLRPA